MAADCRAQERATVRAQERATARAPGQAEEIFAGEQAEEIFALGQAEEIFALGQAGGAPSRGRAAAIRPEGAAIRPEGATIRPERAAPWHQRSAWTQRSQSRPRLEAVPALLQAEPGIAVAEQDLDAGPWLLGAANGTVDLRTGRLHPPRRAELVTRSSPAAYDPAAACPLWERTLGRLLSDPDVRRFFWKACGYALAGVSSEQCLLLLVGRGGNGKSTVLETLRAALGDYALETPAETLMRRPASGPTNDVARLRGARLVTARESEAGGRLSESLVKHLTGGDRLAARFLYQEFAEFEAACTLMLATNHEPEISGTDEGIWRRVRLVRFGVTLAEGERDRHLRESLRAELPGILSWCVRGCLAWQAEGLAPPPAVQVDTAAYREGQDVLGAFLSERCETGPGLLPSPGLSAGASALYGAYASWARQSGESPLSLTRFGRQLTARGFAPVRAGGRVTRTGLALRE